MLSLPNIIQSNVYLKKKKVFQILSEKTGPFKSFNLRKSRFFLLVSSSEIDLTLKFDPRNVYLGLKKTTLFSDNFGTKK